MSEIKDGCMRCEHCAQLASMKKDMKWVITALNAIPLQESMNSVKYYTAISIKRLDKWK